MTKSDLNVALAKLVKDLKQSNDEDYQGDAVFYILLGKWTIHIDSE